MNLNFNPPNIETLWRLIQNAYANGYITTKTKKNMTGKAISKAKFKSVNSVFFLILVDIFFKRKGPH